ncbi:MAG: phosphatase [Bacteroidia bacterium]|nr:phosphatase [Bacteroidia bacterium]
MPDPKKTVSAFKKSGGIFLTPTADLEKKVKKIKAYIFDWDGVFNDSSKTGSGESYFTEVDSMGLNMLRFSNWLLNKEKMPLTAVISGEETNAAKVFVKREHFTAAYFKAKDKKTALTHFCEKHNLKPAEIAFVFDDILDLSIAERVGVRILVKRNANPLFTEYVKKNKLADYITGTECGNFCLREAAELLIGLSGNFDKVIKERTTFSKKYTSYIHERNSLSSEFFLLKENKITTL